jgi:hypothetical protein
MLSNVKRKSKGSEFRGQITDARELEWKRRKLIKITSMVR